MKAIIIGAAGQDGYYLKLLLESEGIDVIGISRSGNFLHTDITNWNEMAALIKSHQPDYLFHLAANSTTRHLAWQENHDTISTASLYILESVKLYSPHTRVFISGSGLQFRNEGKPIKETDTFEASSIYSANRIYTVYLARYYRTFGLKIYIGYFFNHESPMRTEKHISKKITNTVKRIAGGSGEKLVIGNLSVRKEWGFAGDIVNGIWTLVKQDPVYESTIGTGVAYSIAEWINTCFAIANIRPDDYVEQEPGFVAEYDLLVSDPGTLNSLGWKPLVSISDLAKMMMK